jgi:hypothetical protein
VGVSVIWRVLLTDVIPPVFRSDAGPVSTDVLLRKVTGVASRSGAAEFEGAFIVCCMIRQFER